MIIPDCLSGKYTEEQLTDIINKLVKHIAPFFIFGYYTIDDIEQEAWIFAIDAINRYNENRGSLESFLWVHIQNRLRNLRRNKLIRKQPPCFTCEYNEPDSQCRIHLNKCNCTPFYKWLKRNDDKRQLMEPRGDFDIEVENYVSGKYKNPIDFLLAKELISTVETNLPVSYRKYYRMFLEDADISKWHYNKLISMIKDILISKGLIENV